MQKIKKLFDPKIDWFNNQHILADLGFIEFAKDYKTKRLSLLAKRQKNTELTKKQKNNSKNIESNKIFVEHAIGGIKRYRVLFNQLRIHATDLYYFTLSVCAKLRQKKSIEQVTCCKPKIIFLFYSVPAIYGNGVLTSYFANSLCFHNK